MTNMAKQSANPDPLVAARALHQHGVVDVAELRAAGLGPSSIALRVRTGRLHRKHRGVYAVGHPNLSREGIWLAAVKACGRGAALSHQSAAQLQKLLSLADYRGPVHVTVPGRSGRRSRKGIEIHRSRTLTRSDLMVREAIVLTNPARTLADLRRVLSHEQWEDAIDRARVLSLPIGDVRATEPTRSRFERRMLALCRRHRLPKPEVNARVGPYLVDFAWCEAGLIVEADSFEHHRSRAAFEADRARDAELRLRGYTVVRFTWRQLTGEPEWVAGTIRALLGAA
jgi:very-short-patch-repair endonuclease